jgi:tRNA 2-thiocytidine biosynthesis protein TtcA
VTPLEKKLARAVGRAVADFRLIAEGDRILVAVSGGKDSHGMLHLLRALQHRAPVGFSLKVVTLDQGQPGFCSDALERYMAREGYDFTVVREDTYSIVTEKVAEGSTYCSLCSRLRRGILYRLAVQWGCTKIALGHHREDLLATMLLNLFFAGKLATMPPKLVSDDGANVVIRPLAYCVEDDLRLFAEEKGFPIIPCRLCGSQPDQQRRAMGVLLDGLEAKHAGLKGVMLAALGNVKPTHLLDGELRRVVGGGMGGGVARDESLVSAQRLVTGRSGG